MTNKISLKDGYFHIEGSIDENFDGKLLAGHPRPLKLDLGRIKNCNSLGVREFLKFMRTESLHGVEFHRCSPAVMDMINSIPSTLGTPPRPEIVKSMTLTYRCADCRKEENFVMQVTPIRGGRIPDLPEVSCGKCRVPMNPLADAEDIFTYLVVAD